MHGFTVLKSNLQLLGHCGHCGSQTPTTTPSGSQEAAGVSLPIRPLPLEKAQPPAMGFFNNLLAVLLVENQASPCWAAQPKLGDKIWWWSHPCFLLLPVLPSLPTQKEHTTGKGNIHRSPAPCGQLREHWVAAGPVWAVMSYQWPLEVL